MMKNRYVWIRRVLFLIVALWVLGNSTVCAQDSKQVEKYVRDRVLKKGESKDNINSYLNSPMIQEWASKPELQAFIKLFAKQIFVVNGRVFGKDEFEPHPYPLQGANVEVKCVGDTAQVFGASTNKDGEFLVPIFLRERLKSNNLHIKISYVGMDGVNKVFTPTEVKLLGQKVLQVEMDSLVLKADPMTLQEAEVIGELRKMYQNGDTVIFNADAYEMPSGSVLLDLVRRLPGLQYIGGRLTYMNRDIEEIRLNGDNFFKRDMGIALQNMPPEKLKSLKVYEVPDDTLDVMSDQHLVMDMTTKQKTNGVMFGNATLGTTAQFNRFMGNADVSRWQKNGGQAHLKFGTSNIPGAGAMVEKDVRTNAGGSYEQTFGATKVEGNANYGYTHQESRTDSYNRIFMPEYTQDSKSESRSGSKSRNYGGNIHLDGHIGKLTYWNTSGSFDRTQRDGENTRTDSVSTNDMAVSKTVTKSLSHSINTSADWQGGVRHYLTEERKTEIGASASWNTGDTKGTNTNITDSRFFMFGDSVRNVHHVIDQPSKYTRWTGRLNFRQQFGEYANLNVNYEFSTRTDNSSQTYSDIVGEELIAIDSLHYNNRYKNVSHGPRISFRYDNKLLLLNFRGAALPTKRTADNIQGRRETHSQYSSVDYQADARMELKMHEQKNKLTLHYNGYNGLPSATDIADIEDHSNPMNIRRGNPNLKESFHHTIAAEYQLGSLLRVSSTFNQTFNQQTTLSVINARTGARTSMPTNINGNWGQTSYIFLTKAIGDVTLAGVANHAYRHTVQYVQDVRDAQAATSAANWHNVTTQVYATYSNKSWMVIGQLNYNIDHNKSDYLDKATKGQLAGASLNMEYTLPLKVNVKVKTDFNFNRKFGYELESANRSEYIWNASAEYRFLDIITAGIEWRDILKSQRGFEANMNGANWSETQRYGNTSMVVLKLSVKLNRFR